MPELPEVETIRLGLAKRLPGLIIKKIQILEPKSFYGNPKSLRGKKVLKVWRRAKILGIDLSGNRGPVGLYPRPMSSLNSFAAGTRQGTPSSATPSTSSILFHLKMSGQVIYRKDRGEMPNRSTRVIFEFDDGSKLYFNDQRKFGWIKVSEAGQGIKKKLLESLGPEPLLKKFTPEILQKNLLRRKNTPVKVAIMDQTIVAGVGNIYAAEALFLAKIDPRKKALELTKQEIKKLHKGIREALTLGIKHKGSTRAHFVNVDGKKGSFLDFANVYSKEKIDCSVCKTPIKKIQLAGRGTYFCPKCQS